MRHDHADSRGHAATGRPKCVGRSSGTGRFWFSSSCPAKRRRVQRIRCLLRPGQADLPGAGGRQADGRLRAPAAPGLRRLARGRLHRDRDGVDRPAWARSPPRAIPSTPPCAGRCGFSPCGKTRDPDLLLGMLDRDADLRLVRTADKAVHYVLAENMKEFRQKYDVVDDQPAWDGGQRGVLSAQRAREEGFCKRTAESSAEVASIYQIGGRSAIEDPTLGQTIRPVWIKLEGPLDTSWCPT